MFEQVIELRLERGVSLGRTVIAIQIKDLRHQRFGDIATAELTKMAVRVGARAEGIG